MHPHNNPPPGEAENASPSTPSICIIYYTKLVIQLYPLLFPITSHGSNITNEK